MKSQMVDAVWSAKRADNLNGNKLIEEFVKEQDIDAYRIVDISHLSIAENRGLSTAILLVIAMPHSIKVDHSVFGETEHRIDTLADTLSEEIKNAGYDAISQSERSIIDRKEFCIETKTTPLPHKKIAVLSGIGWIGKSNLLVTEKYGSALCMCSVLTDMPLEMVCDKMQEVKCGSCNACKVVCPAKVITGTCWTPYTKREEIVDVYHCETCLKCMSYCKYSQKTPKA